MRGRVSVPRWGLLCLWYSFSLHIKLRTDFQLLQCRPLCLPQCFHEDDEVIHCMMDEVLRLRYLRSGMCALGKLSMLSILFFARTSLERQGKLIWEMSLATVGSLFYPAFSTMYVSLATPLSTGVGASSSPSSPHSKLPCLRKNQSYSVSKSLLRKAELILIS